MLYNSMVIRFAYKSPVDQDAVLYNSILARFSGIKFPADQDQVYITLC